MYVMCVRILDKLKQARRRALALRQRKCMRAANSMVLGLAAHGGYHTPKTVSLWEAAPAPPAAKGLTPDMVEKTLAHSTPVAACARVVETAARRVVVQRLVSSWLFERVIEENGGTASSMRQQPIQVVVRIPPIVARIHRKHVARRRGSEQCKGVARQASVRV